MAQQPQAQENGFSGAPKAVAEQTSQSIPSNLQQAFTKVVAAGEKLMFSKETHKYFMEAVNQEGDLGQNVGKAMAGLMGMMFEESNQTMPIEVMPSAGIYLIAKGAEFIEEVTGQEITPDIIATATQELFFTLGQMFQIPPERMMAIAEKSAAGGYE